MLKAIGWLGALAVACTLVALTDGALDAPEEPLAIVACVFVAAALFVFGSFRADLRALRFPPEAWTGGMRADSRGLAHNEEGDGVRR